MRSYNGFNTMGGPVRDYRMRGVQAYPPKPQPTVAKDPYLPYGLGGKPTPTSPYGPGLPKYPLPDVTAKPTPTSPYGPGLPDYPKPPRPTTGQPGGRPDYYAMFGVPQTTIQPPMNPFGQPTAPINRMQMPANLQNYARFFQQRQR